MSFVVIVAFPAASKATVKSLQVTVGATLSSIVTTATHDELFPAASSTVSVTLFGPTLGQVKAETSIEVAVTAQLSVDALSTSAATIVALPEASN